MAVRIRKLAKEWAVDPWALIGLLHAIGFTRFRTPDDMLSDAVVEKAWKAKKDGVSPVEIERPTPSGRAVAGQPTTAPLEPDVMSKLVPGVTPAHRSKVAPTERSAVPAKPPVPVTASVDVEALSAERDSLRQAAEQWRAAFEAQKALVSALESELSVLRQRPVKSESPVHHSRVDWVHLFEARGLRGRDEFERALMALAQQRRLLELLDVSAEGDSERISLFLRDQLRLVARPTPGASVVVATERADSGYSGDDASSLSALSELLLLHGLRRLHIVGGPSVWQRTWRGHLDPRIEIRFSAATPRRRADAESDVTRQDLLILCDVKVDGSARVVYDSARTVIVEVAEPSVASVLAGLRSALAVEDPVSNQALL